MPIDQAGNYRARKMLHGGVYSERYIQKQGHELPIMCEQNRNLPKDNPFKSEKQRKYLYANKPKVAKKFSLHMKNK